MSALALWILTLSPSVAYEYIDYTVANGGHACGAVGLTWASIPVDVYTFDGTNVFTTGEKLEIKRGMEAWDAGPGTVNRGADFGYDKVGSLPIGSQSVDNGRNEIYHMTEAEGIALGFGDDWLGYASVWVDTACSQLIEADVVFRNDTTYTSGLPSQGTNELSLATISAHEFGHALGLDHNTDDYPAIMNRHVFAENVSEVRLGEDDYAALLSLHPLPTSTGRNFMLTKWDVGPDTTDDDRVKVERWAKDWPAAGLFVAPTCGSIPMVPGYSPSKIWASVNGTGGPYSPVPIEWTLSVDSTCFNGDDILIGTRGPGLITNTPYPVGPDGDAYFIPATTPNGPYYVCAGINPDATYAEAESSYDDNTIISEGQWNVDCP